MAGTSDRYAMPYAHSVYEPVIPTPLQVIRDPALESRGIRLLIKRDDLIRPAVPGNKWRKLKYNLEAARNSGLDTILTFGGAYSNHIYATASAGRLFGFRTIGIIRGEEHLPLNDVLRHASSCGMELHYMGRETYRHKEEAEVVNRLRKTHGDFYLLPEGGTNCLAVRGCAEIISEIHEDFDYICCSMGTGGTLTGLVAGLAGRAWALGFSSLKGGSFLNKDVRSLLADCHIADRNNWSVVLDYHFGGFAKKNADLNQFIESFRMQHDLVLDFVYTGKMMFGLFDLARRGYFAAGATVVALHTGGRDTTRTLSFDPIPNCETGPTRAGRLDG
jgi:1-aminocyclopropane-1-carboxylate deaminase